MRRKVKTLICIAIVVIALTGVILFANRVLNPYNEKADRIERALYSEDDIFQDVDIAFVGGSHGVNGFNPQEVYKETGYTAYNFSLSGSPIYMTYFYLKEMYKTRKPPVVVMDVYYAGMKNDWFRLEDYVYDIVRCMRPGVDKLTIAKTCLSKTSSRWSAILPMLQYHDRWERIEVEDIMRENEEYQDYLLGSDYYYQRNSGKEITFGNWDSTTKAGGMNKRTKEYLQKIIELTKENGSKLLLVDLPHKHEDSGAPDTWADNEYEIMNEVKEMAEKSNVDYLQYDESVLRSISFQPKTDMYNRGHMNYWGSVKVSRYLADYIKKHMTISTATSCKEQWDEYIRIYEKKVIEGMKNAS